MGHLEGGRCVRVHRELLDPDDLLGWAGLVPRVGTQRTVVPTPRRLVNTEGLLLGHGWLSSGDGLLVGYVDVFPVHSFDRIEGRLGFSSVRKGSFLHFGEMSISFLFGQRFSVVVIVLHVGGRATEGCIATDYSFLRRHGYEVRRARLHATVFALETVARLGNVVAQVFI